MLLFTVTDCYNLVLLVELFPFLSNLIEENKDKITAIGWEKLLINDYDKYSKICNFELLTRKNFESIILVREYLKNVLKQYYI